MSLDWKMPDNCDKSLLTYKTSYDGEIKEQMHPVLHSLIFLTMALDTDYTKDIEDVKRRAKWIRKVNPEYLTLEFGYDAQNVNVWTDNHGWVSFLKYWGNFEKRVFTNSENNGWKIIIDDEWIEKYKGLWTNVGHKPFKTWFKRYNDVSLKSLERWGK